MAVATAVLPDPRIAAVGVVRLVLVPSPSLPTVFEPQHWTDMLSMIAHVCPLPAATASTERTDSMATLTGVLLDEVPPSPSCPSLLLPQHLMLPSLWRPQL